jgi:4'-phosphopantetheinyl transferase EntD
VTPAFKCATPFGWIVGVTLPEVSDAAGVEALHAALSDQERAHVATLAPLRRVTWAGGRLALRAALAEAGARREELGALIGATGRGAPALPAGFAGSISHKNTVAVALASRADGDTTLGVDVELERERRVDISTRVLTDDERAALAAMDHEARPREVLAAFATKEAIYKALDPWVQRYVAFQEVSLARGAGGARVAALRLTRREGPFSVEVLEEPEPGLILVAARVVRPGG